MEIRTLLRIQKVILDQLLAFKAEESLFRVVRDDDRVVSELNKLSALSCFSFRPFL